MLLREARRLGYDGVVCGHIHKAEIREVDGMTYANDGDWVESCTAVAEGHDGAFEIITWTQTGRDSEPAPADETADGMEQDAA